LVGLLRGALLAGGCGTVASVAAPEPVAVQEPAVAPSPGLVRLTGDVRTPRDLDADDLAALPHHTVAVEYESGSGHQSRSEAGVLLADLVPADGLATTDRKIDALSFGVLAVGVLAVGSDGYAALVSFGEISPEFGDRGVLLATAEDGKPLERPRLVVPGDVKGGRYVSDVVELRAIRTAD
jgi:hypothetical protein